MLNVIRSLLFAGLAFFRTRRELAVEILALRHQLGVLKRSVKRARLTDADRGLWVLLSRRWQVYLARPYRERAARCKVCGKPFEWESRDVTVPPMCPACLEAQQDEPVVWVCARCAPVAAKPLVREVPPVVECPICGAHCHRGVTEVQAVRAKDFEAAQQADRLAHRED